MVKEIIKQGETIKTYSDDKPYPSYLIFNTNLQNPLHVLVAKDEINDICIVITAYTPEIRIWKSDFKSKQ